MLARLNRWNETAAKASIANPIPTRTHPQVSSVSVTPMTTKQNPDTAFAAVTSLMLLRCREFMKGTVDPCSRSDGTNATAAPRLTGRSAHRSDLDEVERGAGVGVDARECLQKGEEVRIADVSIETHLTLCLGEDSGHA